VVDELCLDMVFFKYKVKLLFRMKVKSVDIKVKLCTYIKLH